MYNNATSNYGGPMRYLILILTCLSVNSISFAQTREQVSEKIKVTMGEKAADFFNEIQYSNKDFIRSVDGIYMIADAVVKDIVAAINQNDAIEVSYLEYIKKHPNVSHEKHEEILFQRVVGPLRKYSPDVSNDLLTFIEIYHRDYTDHASFVHERAYFFYQKVRDTLGLPKLDSNICIVAIGDQSCPPVEAQAAKPKEPYRRISPRLEHPTSK